MLGISENELADQISENMTCGSKNLQYKRSGVGRARGDNSSQENDFENVIDGTVRNRGQSTNKPSESLDILTGETNDSL